jgi:hypothetical protein
MRQGEHVGEPAVCGIELVAAHRAATHRSSNGARLFRREA